MHLGLPMPEPLPADQRSALILRLTALADDELLLAHRDAEWTGHAPMLEEDIALANIALDLIGHTRFLYSYAGTAWGKSEDDLAYFREEEE